MSSPDNTGTPPPSAIVSGYEQLWRTAGRMPDLVSYVAATPKLEPHDLAALVHIDQRHRHAAGAPLSAETYFESFPLLRDNIELALDVVYQEYALRREAGEVYPTGQYLARFPDLAERLAMQFELDSALGDEMSPATVGAQATVESSSADAAETIVAGRYKLLEEIGEGGMGTVWMAQQTDPVRRRVALKLIKPGMDSRQVLLRFEAERQALALMDHPHIAKVFDGGVTHDGRPFFVMEYVKGQPITEYCDEARLSVSERLKLFVQVCQAVQHAHQKGIIHRDLKPSNILVCPFDGQPVPKVIDFGLAKAMHQGLTERTLFTAHGMMIGTPLYMSPEQAETNNLDIDTRSDVYSLGVVLYELLTGSTPLEKRRVQDAACQEMLRLIREEEPPKPSTRLSGSGSLPMIAAQRNLEPAQLSRAVRGDLDWIVMKSLEKERSRRYETANGLARDIERYLHDDPVEARPPSTGYRFRKFARRNKATLLTLLVVSTALIVGTAVSTWQALRATRAENLAESRLGAETEARLAEIEQRKVAEQARGDAERERVEAERQRAAAVKQRDLAQWNLYVANIDLAHRDWNVGHLARMSRALESHQPHGESPDLRGWEWYYLASLLRKQKSMFHPQLGAISQVKWNPAGRLVAIAGDSGVKIYEPTSQQVVHFIAGHALVAWSSDGSRLVTAMIGQQKDAVKIWDTQNWQELFTVRGSDGPIHAITWRADGRALAWAGSSVRGRFYIWEEGRPELVSFTVPDVNGPHLALQRVAWGTEGRWLAMGGAFPASLVIWDPIEQKMAKRLDTNGRGLTHIAWSPDGKRVAAATFDGDLRMWNVEGDEPPQSIAAHHGQMAECCWSADGKRLASGGEDNLVRIWNAETGQQLNRLPGHRAMVSSVDWSSKGNWIVSGARDGTVGLWRPDESVDALLIRGRETSAWSPDGSRVAANDPRHKGGETYSILDSRSGQTVKVLQSAFHGSMHVFAWSPNGNMIAGAGFHGGAFVWDAASGKLLHSIPKAHTPNENGVAETRCIAWSPDSRQFATCGLDRLVKIWDSATGKPLRTLADHASELGSVRWSPDGKWFASADWGRDIKIRATDTWQICWEIDQEPALGGDYIIAWGPDSQRLAAVNASGQIVVWKLLEPKSLEKLWAIDAHTSNIRSIAWSPDGRRIASGSEDRTAKVWDAETGRELLTLEGHSGMVKSVAWSPDSRRLASADEVSLHIWDATEAYAD